MPFTPSPEEKPSLVTKTLTSAVERIVDNFHKAVDKQSYKVIPDKRDNYEDEMTYSQFKGVFFQTEPKYARMYAEQLDRAQKALLHPQSKKGPAF